MKCLGEVERCGGERELFHGRPQVECVSFDLAIVQASHSLKSSVACGFCTQEELEHMPGTQDEFEHWLFEMDDRLDELISFLPSEAASRMDFSADSLSVIEAWLLNEYSSPVDLLKKSEKTVLDMVARYVGETFRRNLGGTWRLELSNKQSVFYGLPVIEKFGLWTECPVSLVTAATDRRSGIFMGGVLNAIASCHGISVRKKEGKWFSAGE